MKLRRIMVNAVSIIGLCFSAQLSADGDGDDYDDSTQVYELLDDINIGKLFFSDNERQRLDALRSGQVPRKPSTSKAAIGARQESESAAGFIAMSSGKSRVFRNGDFQPGDIDADMQFPGDVKIIVTSTQPKLNQPKLNQPKSHRPKLNLRTANDETSNESSDDEKQ